MPIAGIWWRGTDSTDWPSNSDLSGAGLVQPAEAIEQRGLAGAVRPDQAGDLAGHDVESDVIQSNHAAEAKGDAADRQQFRRDF